MVRIRSDKRPGKKSRRLDSTGDEQIRSRLHRLLERYSQAEIARRTGVPSSYVNRYLKGTAVPAAFCRLVVNELGVNPDWLITGHGAVWRDEVRPDASETGEAMLELIRAMAAVKHTQLGAMAGKHHLRVLRELREAANRYDALRGNLNRGSAPLLRRILGDLRHAIDKRDYDLAMDLGKTAQELERFSDDHDLALETTLLLGRLALSRWDLNEALEQTRKAVTLGLRAGMLRELELEAITEGVAYMSNSGRAMEARRVARATLELASEELRRSSTGCWLKALIANAQVLAGEIGEGLKTLLEVSGRLSDARRLKVDGYSARALALSGAMDTSAAIAFGGDSQEKAMNLTGFAGLMEDERSLAAAVAYLKRCDVKQEWLSYHARLLLDILRGDKSNLKAKIKPLAGFNHPAIKYPPSILVAQLYRIAGHKADAREYFRKSCRDVAKVPAWFSLGLMWEARHMRNALELGNRARQQQAREFFHKHVELGYLCFRDFTSAAQSRRDA